MILPRWSATPLVGTAAIAVILALLAIPLHRLTSAAPQAHPAPRAGGPAAATPAVPAVLYLHTLAPAREITISSPDGPPILQLGETPAGEHDFDTTIPLQNHHVELILTASFPNTQNETAVFLTIEPDGLEAQTRHAIGSGTIDEFLLFSWPHD